MSIITKLAFRMGVCEELKSHYPDSDMFELIPTAFLSEQIDKWYEGTAAEGVPVSELSSRISFAARQIVSDLRPQDALFDVHRQEKKLPSREPEGAKPQPPKDALFLMRILYSRGHREGLLGDLEEDFNEDIETFNPKQAVWLYRWGVLRSLWPSIMAWCARGAVFGKLLEWFHKFTS